MLTRTLAAFLSTIVFLTFASSAMSQDSPPQTSLDGLELIERLDRGEIYADPGIDWSVYTEILLDPATVAFRRNWQRDQNRTDPFRVRDSDVERIKKELATLFDDVFSRELTANGGYRIADQSGESVMRIGPHIVDLDVYAPDTNRTSYTRSYTDRSGQMTLKLHIYDSVTGDLIASVSDRQEAPHRGFASISNAVSNEADAQLMLTKWATALRERLDQARSQ
jgi:hypothetical protein